ncbi:MAG TPA: DUF1127 domain-containing protein [Reyranella sp.]|jgi:uncharacterized protein YjiS (DUF1127 family)|nr:DUF1127 domain-containing protein [Reyranella sp.]
MTHPLRHHDLVHYAADVTVRLHDRDDYIVRSHEFVDHTRPRDSGGLIAMLRTWRRRYVTRRQLGLLDARGLADIGIDASARDREITKPFWQL